MIIRYLERQFNGKVFHTAGDDDVKEEAQQRATVLRKKGYKVRITPTKWVNGMWAWQLWTCPKLT